jgi:hypothetical protein
MNIPSLTPREIIEVVLKRKWWALAGLTTCTTLACEGREYSLKSFKSTVIGTNV